MSVINSSRRSHSILKSVVSFADHTSLHGVPRIIRAESLPARIFWSCVCIGAVFTFVFYCSDLLRQYLSYQKKVSVEIVQGTVPFPFVTVCNTGHLDTVVVDRIEKMIAEEMYQADYYESSFQNDTDQDVASDCDTSETEPENKFIEAFFDKYNNFRHNMTPYYKYYTMGGEHTKPDDTEEKAAKDMIEISSRLGLSANVGPELASAVGVQVQDFIAQCQFLGKKCNVSQFVKHFDPYYFNCYSFDAQSMVKSGATRLAGTEYGLSLLLFAGASGRLRSNVDKVVPGLTEYDPALVSGQGARVVVHAPHTLPIPTAEGYDVPAGFSVTIGVRARENVRISQPHGNCTNEDDDGDIFRPTLVKCQLQCIQLSIMQVCGCIDNRLPRIPGLATDKTLPICLELLPLPIICELGQEPGEDDERTCRNITATLRNRLQCRKNIHDNATILNPDLMDQCQCFPPCKDVVYDVGYSLSSLPEPTPEHESFYLAIENFVDSLPAAKRKLYERLNITANKMIARLNVYIADSNIIKTTESPDYELIRLVSDIGGQLGLWIGISIITIVEVIQLAGDVIRQLMSPALPDDNEDQSGAAGSTVDERMRLESPTDRERSGAGASGRFGNKPPPVKGKYRLAEYDDVDDVSDWRQNDRPEKAKNGSLTSLPVDEMTSVI